ncbi:hypothetical protein TNCV_2974671 [Trichonephila clavipes]|nr:hypothetical protein TNCV_2974671 [Trichonephila clavipes]
MPWPKIHRWRLFVTRIDRRHVASVQSGRIILHHAPPLNFHQCMWYPLRFCVGVAHYAISCGRCVSREMSLALSNSSSVHLLSSSMSCLMTARAKSVRTLTDRPERCPSLVDTRLC